MNRCNRTIAAYVACMAMALQALWPLIAQAKPRSVTLVPVCTVQGVTHYLELPASSSPLEQKSSSQHEHCSYCSFGAERAAAPSSRAGAVAGATSLQTEAFVDAAP